MKVELESVKNEMAQMKAVNIITEGNRENARVNEKVKFYKDGHNFRESYKAQIKK
jgi:hypothetical protein